MPFVTKRGLNRKILEYLLSWKKSKQRQIGSWVFKLRLELRQAMEELGMTEERNVEVIMVNLSWNSKDWKEATDEVTNFRYTQENIPHESWNFDFENERNKSGKILGFVQFTNPPKTAESCDHLIIFSSEKKIVGFYGKSEILRLPKKYGEYQLYNLIAPKELCILLENKIDNSDKHLLFGRERIGQIGFNKMDIKSGLEVLNEAKKSNPNQINQIEKIIEWLNNQGETMKNTNKIGEYEQLLKSNHNIILHGAPGTGKTHLAKEIALKLIFPTEQELTFENMNEEQKKRFNEQYSFVQFHPSYDYTDFVEGLRPDPETSINGQIGFKRMDGVFKEFCKKAVKNFFELSNDEKLRYISSYLNTEPTIYANEKLQNVMIKIIEDNKYQFINDEVSNPDNKTFSAEDCIYKKNVVSQAIYKNVEEQYNNRPPFIFIIDEINRGEISKIFGELFFSIDPDYRGKKGAVKTQYANMINNANEFDAVLQKEKSGYGWFFVPENVYIIGTMNDIDRSVESMDFAMRRRFIFKEITAEESAENMKLGDEAKRRMTALNDAISKIDGLGSSYHIGAAYFLKNGEPISTDEDFDELWDLRLESLLKEYLRGTGNEDDIKKLRNAFFSLPDDNNQQDDDNQTEDSEQ